MLRLLICSSGDGCGQFHQRSRPGAAALVVIVAGAVLDATALICSPGVGCGKIHQRSRPGAVVLAVVAVGAVLDAVAPDLFARAC